METKIDKEELTELALGCAFDGNGPVDEDAVNKLVEYVESLRVALLDELLSEVGEDVKEPSHAGYTRVEASIYSYAKATNTERARWRAIINNKKL